ncbi:Bifunctional purine biosynthetic protein ade1 [Xylographa carneopallida]|nr:Bifunctional purine biosynthetic protein ade1 [Xylographa carneopallida]
MAAIPFTASSLGETLPLLASGKIRDLYEIDARRLLFVASDRISAYDVIMKNGVPEKGALLTLLSAHWFHVLSSAIPSLKTHFISLDIPFQVPQELHTQLGGRSMQVRKLQIFPIEAIVRGYITGSAWKEYLASGTVHGIKVEPGLKESEAFPQGAIYTPSTKAEAGQNDENIHPDQAVQIVGEKYAKRIEQLALELYSTARKYALERGIIIADTKFEFGLDTKTDEVILVDEVLTPDSSRFWPASSYKIGQAQESFDKQ